MFTRYHTETTSGKKPKGKLDKSQIGLPSEFRYLH